MFVLKRILNSGCNVPEPIRLPVTASTSYKYGAALAISSGALVNCSATTTPTYIAAQSFKAGDGSTMLAFPVSKDMIFETKVSATPTSLAVGNKVTLNVVSSSADGVTATTTSGVATIIDLLGATAAGDPVLVSF